MRALVIILMATFICALAASPAMALSAEEQTLMNNITQFEADINKKADSSESKANQQKAATVFKQCVVRFARNPQVRKRLRTSKNKKFVSSALSTFNYIGQLIAAYRFYRQDILAEAATLEGFNFTDPVLEAAASGGAKKIRIETNIFTKAKSPNPACFMLETLRRSKWIKGSDDTAIYKGMGWTQAQLKALNDEMEAENPALVAGYEQLVKSGASQEELGLYADLFEIAEII